MPRHPHDLRRTHGEQDDDALAQLGAGRDGWIAAELRLARLLHRIDRKSAFLYIGAASIEELAERSGYDPDRARQLVLLGYALAGEPGLEAALREGRVRWVAARALGRIHRDPRLLAPGDDWLRLAAHLGIRDLRRRIRERIESVLQEVEAPVTFAAAITVETRQELRRARDLASQKAAVRLTNGQVVRVLATVYNDLFDPLRKTPRKRRMPDTAMLPEARGVPADVVRAVLRRSGGVCEFGGCERAGEELCHVKPHAKGSAREARDLVHGCHRHHSQFDKGTVTFLGWADDGGPSFFVPRTKEILMPKPPPEDRASPPRPGWLVRAARRPKRVRRKEPPPGSPPEASGDVDDAGAVRERGYRYVASGGAPPAPAGRSRPSPRRRPDARTDDVRSLSKFSHIP